MLLHQGKAVDPTWDSRTRLTDLIGEIKKEHRNRLTLKASLFTLADLINDIENHV